MRWYASAAIGGNLMFQSARRLLEERESRRPRRAVRQIGAGLALLAAGGPALAEEATSNTEGLFRGAFEAETRALGERVSVASAQPEQQGPIIGGYIQFRYLATAFDDAGGEDFANGFQLQRARIIVRGTIGGDEEGGPTFDYLLLPFTGPSGTWSILDAWVRWRAEEHWTVQAGQFKLPFWREWLISERFILPIERSEVTATYASIYAQGVQVGFNDGNVRANFAFSDGLRSFNTAFNNDAEADYALTARGEYLAFGEWGQFSDATALNAEQDALMFGAAVHHQGETESFRGVSIDHLTQATADVSWEVGDLALMAAGVVRLLEPSAGEEELSFGGLAQGGYMVRDDVEVFGRYEFIVPDSDVVADDTYHAITGGLNWYIRGHSAKLSVDAVYSFGPPDDTGVIGFGPNAGTGLLDGQDDQLALRAQFQFIF